jgi:F0F1-type ATP synthase membrane subunit b/b'
MFGGKFMVDTYITVDTLFRILNTSIVFGFFYYVFKKYIYPWVHSLVQVRITQVSSLLDKRSILQSKKLTLEADIKRQRRYAQHVSELVENWNEKIDESLRKHAEEKKAIDRTIHEYLSKRSDALSMNTLIRRITPVLLTDTQNKLEALFKNGTSGATFVNEIVHYFKSQEEAR